MSENKDYNVVLNGIRTWRYVYDAIAWPTNHNLSVCDPPVCRVPTRPYYTLVDDGGLYVTTPTGIIFYLGPNTDTMVQVYPINAKLTDESEVPGFEDLEVCDQTPTSITFCWINPNEKGVNWERIVRATQSLIVPWRPGRAGCNLTITTNETPATGIIIPESDYFSNPKVPDAMELPFANGYYVVQDGPEHCVVFYHDTLIYEGRFNGRGIAASFAYGVRYCRDSEMCCRVTDNLNWTYTMFPKWKQNQNEKFVAISLWDQARNDMGVTDRGIITVGNVVHSNRDDDDYDPEEDSVVLTIMPFVVDDRNMTVLDVFVNGGMRECAVYGGDRNDLSSLLISLHAQLDTAKANEETLSGECAVLNSQLAAISLTAPSYQGIFTELCAKSKALQNASQLVKTVEKRIKNAELVQTHGGVQRGQYYGLVKVSTNGLIREYVSSEELARQIEEVTGQIAEAGEVVTAANEAVTAKQAKIDAITTNIAVIDTQLAALTEQINQYVPESPEYLALAGQIEAKTNEKIAATAELAEETAVLDGLKADAQIAENNLRQLNEALYTLNGSDQSVSEAVLATLVGNRVLWSFRNNAYWAPPREEEKIGHVIDACDYEFLYTCTRTQEWRECEGGGAQVRSKTWYEGTGYSVTDSDSRFQISKWMIECCKICRESAAGHNPCSEYKCGGGDCACSAPTQCGTCYPITVESSEPLWKHIPPGECDPDLAEKLLTAYPNFCDDSNNVSMDSTIYVPLIGYPIPMETARITACQQNETGEQPRIEKTVQCQGEVATAKLDELGGRIFPIYGAYNQLTKQYERTNWAYINRTEPSCKERKDYTIIGPLDSASRLPGMVELDSEDIRYSKIGLNAANAMILRAPGSLEHDTDTGFTPGFVINTDPLQVKEYFTRFYPAYLSRPGFQFTLVNSAPTQYDSDTGTYKDAYFNIHRGIFPPAPDMNSPDPDGIIWHFYRFVKVENDWKVEWVQVILVSDAIAKATHERVEKAIANGESTPTGDTTPEGLTVFYTEYFTDLYHNERGLADTDYVNDWENGDTEQILTVTMPLPGPPQDEGVTNTSETSGTVGKWYVQGPVVNQAAAISAQSEAIVENGEVTFDANSGIHWKQYVQSWGDPKGIPVRVGIQAGDVFYHKISTQQHQINVPVVMAGTNTGESENVSEEIDTYWYWTGYQWKDGTSYFSEINDKKVSELAIFYKNEGGMDLKPKTEEEAKTGDWEACAKAKALFIGKVGSMAACGDLLAINFNMDSTYHKVLAHTSEVIVDIPASSEHYTSSTGEKMQEGMVCAGDTYVMVVYNIGPNTQHFHLWMQDYSEADDNTQTNTRSTLEEWGADFSYDDVPNIFDIKSSWVTRAAIKKYGERAQKNYLILKARTGNKLYVFYKGKLRDTAGTETTGATYTDGSVSASGTICGPRYAVVACPTSGHYDIWVEGVRKHENILCKIHLNGALIECPLWQNSGTWGQGNGAQSRSTGVNAGIATAMGDEFIWAYANFDVDGTFSMKQHANCYFFQMATYGDYTYYAIGTCDAPNEAVEGTCDGSGNTHKWTATYKGFLWNRVTEELQPVCDPILKFPEFSGFCADNGVDVVGVGTTECRTGTHGTFPLRVVNFKPAYNFVEAGNGGGHDYSTDVYGCSGLGFSVNSLIYKDEVTRVVGTSGSSHNVDTSEVRCVIGTVGIWDDGDVRCYDWNGCNGHNGTISPCVVDPDRYSDTQFAACRLNETSCALSFNKDTGRALYVHSDGSSFIGTLPNACSCDGVRTECRYIQWEKGNGNYETYYLTTKLSETGKITWCCGSGSTDYGNYAMFENGHLYYGKDCIDGTFTGTTQLGCCGDAVLFRDNSGKHWFYVGGESVAIPGDTNNGADFKLTCCGIDYYLLQRGSFEKLRPPINYERRESNGQTMVDVEVMDGEGETSTTQAILSTTTITETCALGQTALLDDGTLVILKAITVLEGESKVSTGATGAQSTTVYHYERPRLWEAELDDEQGVQTTVEFEHDISYAFETTSDENGTYVVDDDLKETKVRHVPWKYTYSREGREVHAFYKTTPISTDPRITELICFRYENKAPEGELVPEYHGIAAYAVFYDDPYNELKDNSYTTWQTGGGDGLTPVTTYHKWVRNQGVVKNVLPLFDPIFDVEEEIWDSPCDCEIKAKIKNAHPNVCLIVWVGAFCESDIDNHKKDTPSIPFCDNFADEAEIAKYRKKVLYINDYNAAVRWDRLTADDPVDEWPHEFYPESAGLGGFWIAPPTFNESRDPDNMPFDSTGRLVASGNTSIFVWDNHDGKNQFMEFNALTGNSVVRGVAPGA